jgi:glucose/arabinose dehydrogenase
VGGAGADYKSLDGLVFDAVQNLLEPWHSQAATSWPSQAATCSTTSSSRWSTTPRPPPKPWRRTLCAASAAGQPAGNHRAFLPDGTVMVTSLANLSIYFQEGARRMHVKEAPERDRVETYESSNDAFVIEDLGKAALVENIEITA